MSSHIISSEEFVQLEGLLSLGRRHVAAMKYLEGEIERITANADAGSEAFWLEEDASEVIEKLDLKVVDILDL